MPNTQTNVPKQPTQHHRWRTFFAGLFGFIALNLIIINIVVFWLGATLTNTDQYVRTVTPLASSSVVNDYVATKVSDALLAQVKTAQQGGQAESQESADSFARGVAEKILTPEQYEGKTTDQIVAQIEPIIKETVHGVMTSETFQVLWVQTNRTLHEKLMFGLTHPDATISIDMRPVLDGVLAELRNTKFAFLVEKIEIPTDAGVIQLQSNKLDNIRRIYNYAKIAMVAIVVAAVVCIGLTVLISVHHQRTFRGILVAVGIASTLYVFALSAVVFVPTISNSPEDTELAKTIFGIVFRDLRLTFAVIAAVAFILAIISKLITVLVARKNTRKSP